jgi:hypothetical protein
MDSAVVTIPVAKPIIDAAADTLPYHLTELLELQMLEMFFQ